VCGGKYNLGQHPYLGKFATNYSGNGFLASRVVDADQIKITTTHYCKIQFTGNVGLMVRIEGKKCRTIQERLQANKRAHRPE
jgi:hypothetical protein